jgi:hypothetical protein
LRGFTFTLRVLPIQPKNTANMKEANLYVNNHVDIIVTLSKRKFSGDVGLHPSAHPSLCDLSKSKHVPGASTMQAWPMSTATKDSPRRRWCSMPSILPSTLCTLTRSGFSTMVSCPHNSTRGLIPANDDFVGSLDVIYQDETLQGTSFLGLAKFVVIAITIVTGEFMLIQRILRSYGTTSSPAINRSDLFTPPCHPLWWCAIAGEAIHIVSEVIVATIAFWLGATFPGLFSSSLRSNRGDARTLLSNLTVDVLNYVMACSFDCVSSS